MSWIWHLYRWDKSLGLFISRCIWIKDFLISIYWRVPFEAYVFNQGPTFIGLYSLCWRQLWMITIVTHRYSFSLSIAFLLDDVDQNISSLCRFHNYISILHACISTICMHVKFYWVRSRKIMGCVCKWTMT